MSRIALIAFATLVLGTQTATAAPVTPAATQSATLAAPSATLIGSPHRRGYARDCTPYAGPFGYYGNPWCEGGFYRDGKAGGWDFDLTPYVDGRADRDSERRYRRSRH